MTTKYVSPTGLDTNNGDTVGTPYLTIDKAFDNLAAGAGIVWLADGDYNQATNLVTSGGAATGSITLKSSSSDASLCSISGSLVAGNYSLIRNDEVGVNLVIENITFKDHHSTTLANPPIFWADQDMTLNDCILDNIQLTATSGAPAGIIRNFHSTLPANLTIAGLTVRNCSVNWSGGIGYEGALWSTNKFGSVGTFSDITIESFTVTTDSNYQFNGTMFHRGTNHFSGTNNFSGITINSAHASYGLIKLESVTSAYQHTIAGTMIIDNVNQTLTTANGDNFGYINVSSDDTLTITADMEIKNCTSDVAAGETDYGFIASTSASSSLIIRSSSAGSYLKIHDNILDDGAGGFGAISNVGGGYVSLSSIEAYNNTIRSGVINITSLGSTTDIFGCLIHDNTSINGGGIYSDPSSGTNIINISNSTITGNAATTGDGMVLNETATTTTTYNVKNTICRNGGVDEISIGGTGVPVVNIYSSDVEGGDPGADVYTDNIDADPLFTDSANNDYSLTSASPCVGIGLKWWTGANKVDAFGEPFADFSNDIGGLMSTHNPFHPVNL